MPNDKFDAFRSIPASRGLTWLAQSLALMRLQPGRLLLIAVFMQVIMGLTQLKVIGMLIIIAVPAISAGVLEALDVIGRGGRPALSLLFTPLTSRQHSGRLFMLGLLVFAVGILSMSLMLSGNEDLFDPEMVTRIEQGDIDALTQMDLGLLGKMALAFLVGVAISGTLSFFTIPLIWFGDRKLGPALAEGLKALAVYWKPFLVLAVGLMVLSIPVGLVTGFLLGQAGSGGLLTVLVMAGIMLLLLAFQMLLFAIQYCTFRDIFGVRENAQPPPAEDDSQLLA